MDVIGCDFRHREEDETALVHTGVGDGQAGLVDLGVGIEEQVEIEEAGFTALRGVETKAAEFRFDGQQAREQIPRR